MHRFSFMYLPSIRVINKKEEDDLQFSITDAMKETKLSTNESDDSDNEDPSPDLPQIRGKFKEKCIIFPIVLLD